MIGSVMDDSFEDGKKGKKEDKGKDEQMLRAAIHYTIYKISEEVASATNSKFSKEIVASLAHHFYRDFVSRGRDLEQFARHARRAKIQPDDVRLMYRNCPDLVSQVNTALKKSEKEKQEAKAGSRPKAKMPRLDSEEQVDSREPSVEADVENDEADEEPQPEHEVVEDQNLNIPFEAEPFQHDFMDIEPDF